MDPGGSVAAGEPSGRSKRRRIATLPERSRERSANLRSLSGDARRFRDRGAPAGSGGTQGTVGRLHARRAGMVVGGCRSIRGSPGANEGGTRGRNPGRQALLSRGGDRGQGGPTREGTPLVRESQRLQTLAPPLRAATTSSGSAGHERGIEAKPNPAADFST